VRGGFGLNEIERLALRVKILFQDPMLNLRALVGELNLEELILNRGGGDDGGGDLRRGAGLLGGWGRGGRWRRALRGLSGRRDGLRLSGNGLLLFRLGLGEEVLVAKEGGDHNEHEGHGGAHVAATTAGALRLQIGIVNFGQRKLPIVCEGRPVGQPLYLW
jgi:hypothetical protein